MTEEVKDLLIVDPAHELIIEGPFNRAVCKKILVFNPSKLRRVAFKLKTTTPQMFFVRPNVGMVKPEETVSIDIFVHPMYKDNSVKGHKFLMQAVEAVEPVPDLHEFWKHVNSEYIWDTKIKVKMMDPRIEGVLDASTEVIESIGEHHDKDGNDPMAILLQQVSMLEENRQHLLQEVETVKKQQQEDKLTMSQNLQQQRGIGVCFYVQVMVAMIFAAVAGGYITKNYL